VVIVIIAILAAIGVPALTGYIDKAQDKKYIAAARDHAVAARAVVDEAYANGELAESSGPYTPSDFVENGNDFVIPQMYRFKRWDGRVLSSYMGDSMFSRVASLLSEVYPGATDDGYWRFDFVGSIDSTSTLLNADGFILEFYPTGNTDPAIYVTYKVHRLEPVYTDKVNYFYDAFYDYGTYDPNAGYEVYRYIEE
jgi:type II secretory pathway pseudopilin PulG